MGRFERITNQRIYQQIVEQITRMLREGTLRPGDRLPPERQLAEEFGVSRAAVREALSALRHMGLVDVRLGEGTFVKNEPEERLIPPIALLLAMEQDHAIGLELLELREALESQSAYLAAERAEPEDLSAIEATLVEMEHDLQAGRLGTEADLQFHDAIARAAGNALLVRTMRSLGDTMQEGLGLYRERLLRIPHMGELLLEEHRAIFAAIRDRNPGLAHERMRDHIRHVRKMLYGEPQ